MRGKRVRCNCKYCTRNGEEFRYVHPRTRYRHAMQDLETSNLIEGNIVETEKRLEYSIEDFISINIKVKLLPKVHSLNNIELKKKYITLYRNIISHYTIPT